jgi:hypothetical protein
MLSIVDACAEATTRAPILTVGRMLACGIALRAVDPDRNGTELVAADVEAGDASLVRSSVGPRVVAGR